MKAVLIGAGLLLAGSGAAMAQNAPAQKYGEQEARYALMEGGCSTATDLTQDQNGTWYATCLSGGAPSVMAIDQTGKITKNAKYAEGMNAAKGRYALANGGCATAGGTAVSPRPDGSYTTTCWMGGTPTRVLVDKDGKITKNPTAGAGISEGEARYMLMQNGCSGPSNISPHPNGTWTASCASGGTARMMVDQNGKVGKL